MNRITRHILILATASALAPPVVSGAESCLSASCHQTIGKKRTVHRPVQGGECLSCHQPHGGERRLPLDGKNGSASLCLKCHDQGAFGKKYQHGPVSEGACLACHEPHDANEKGLLKAGGRELCLNCHDDFAMGLKTAERVHTPVRDKSCTSCHDPHSSNFRYLLKNKMPDLCIECHRGLGKRIKGAKFMHQPLLDKKGCGSCHSTHFSRAKGLLAADQEAICLGCHGGDSGGKSATRNIAQEVASQKSLHGPIRDRKCAGCHDPHASDFARLLTGAFPAGFYASYREDSYDFCLSCHNKNMLRFPETTMYTKFRNGDKNLHYLHVVDSRKGHSCRACHQTHAADGPLLVSSEGVNFGKWKLLTRFEPTPTGGSCAPGCHQRYSYDRNKPVLYEHAEGAEPKPK